ncbi:DUF4159 domain-containing protein [Roseobacter sp. HKCCA0434]|uniref:DUF4159 domain-containing protein n=1 Tax=Roseobacter sp. HKCCA0434 TaxID=3079297 RepID=UPI00290581FD|nr:DUF4159 domain-containing protein [Roseobacter sp. HKCCA0434]
MLTIGTIGFATPLLLVALAALPVLWWLLRATPPAPVRRRFPGVSLLLGLRDEERMPARTPWWLLALRIAALALAILGLAGPILNPVAEAERGEGALLIAMDGGWASAPDWANRQREARAALDRADRAGRTVHLVSLADPNPDLGPRPAAEWQGVLDDLDPAPWAPDRAAFAERLRAGALEDVGAVLWLSDGLGDAGGLAELLPRAEVIVPEETAAALAPARFEDGLLVTEVLRAPDGAARAMTLDVIGTDRDGAERVLDRRVVELEAGAETSRVEIELPLELRNRVTRLALAAPDRSAGATVLADDALQRKRIALISAETEGEGQELTSPLHYLRNALMPIAEVVEPPLAEVLDTQADVIVLADVAQFSDAERQGLEEWVAEGGLLVRFAGPRMAAEEEGDATRDPLLPVRLRAGGRSLGGTMSWGDPKLLRPFPVGTLFDGLEPPEEVDVVRQVIAEPDPDLSERTLAALEDGTPLVTARDEGRGRVILFHVTATPRWSSLPLSGLFLDMLDRIARTAQGAEREAEIAEGSLWVPERVLTGRGDVIEADRAAGIDGARLAAGMPGPDAPPGLYRSGVRGLAFNVSDGTVPQRMELPGGMAVRGFAPVAERDLAGPVLAAALAFLILDVLATLALGGRLRPAGRAGIAAMLALVLMPVEARAQQGVRDDPRGVYATSETVLAYVATGDAEVDRISRAGLRGLSVVLTRRTAIEPAPPVAVDIERDELAFYPFLYWPMVEGQDPPGPEAVARLNTYLRSGGMILFDTRDAHLTGGGSGPGNAILRRLAGELDLPPLERVPEDHVLTRTFYLLDDFPGRYVGQPVWVEASLTPEDVEGVPFRSLNDGVSPVVIGANDWASAWAMDESGGFIRPVGRGMVGERQREMALRFGVNLVMYVMTGNYKSDQVHVPALLERLGQ